MSQFLFWFGAILILIAGGLTAAIFVLSPAEMVRTELIRQVKANTGRTLAISGTPSLTFYPSIGVSLPQVSLSAPPGMNGGPMIRADRLHVAVSLMPLLSSRVVVEQLNLARPIINLQVDRQGRRSWDFAAANRTTRLAGLPTAITGIATDASRNGLFIRAAAGDGKAGASLTALDKLELRAVRITDGLIQYLDERTGSGEIVSGVDVTLTGRRIADPISITGALTWNGQRLDLQAGLTTLRKLLSGAPAQTKLVLTSKLTDVRFDGTLLLGLAPKILGTTKLQAASFRNLLRWTGIDLPNAKPLGGLSLNGKLSATATAVALENAKIVLGETTADGRLAVRLAAARPFISANLRIAKLDIDRLNAGFDGMRMIKRRKPRPLSAGSSATPPKSIEEILRGTQSEGGGAGRFSTQVRGYTKGEGWSRDPIDTAALQAFDADARLKVKGLRIAGLAIDQTSLRTTLTNGSARADVSDITLYGGRGNVVVTARSSQQGIKFGINASLGDVSALPLLKDAAELDLIAGKGRLAAALGGNGRSQFELVSSLAGRASFTFTDGAIVGWNIPQMLRGIQAGQLSNFGKTSTAKTDFSELSANFTVSRGIANTQDLKMHSPLLRMAGSGNTDIGQKQLDMILRPKLVASLAGQGGQADLGGLEIPVRISGPWSKPNVVPDIAGVLGNQATVNGAVNSVKKLREKYKGKNAGEIVRDLFGNKNKDGDGNTNNNAGTLLKNLFKN